MTCCHRTKQYHHCHTNHDDANQTMRPLDKYATGQCMTPSPKQHRTNIGTTAALKIMPPNRHCCCLQTDGAATASEQMVPPPKEMGQPNNKCRPKCFCLQTSNAVKQTPTTTEKTMPPLKEMPLPLSINATE